MEAILGLVIIIVYLFPTIVAVSKKRTNTSAILLVNVALGWTLLGWFIALVWATTEGKK